MVSPTAAPERWFGGQRPRTAAEVTLFCLPYAGGGALPYRRWPAALPVAVDVVPLQLPGREARITEPPRIDPREIADVITSWADRPYAVYGHSLGGRIGIEVVRDLRRRGAPLPVRLYVGGVRPPHVIDPLARLADLSDDRFVAEIGELGGTAPGVLEEPDLRDLLLPTLRADFRWLADHRFEDEAPIPVPIVAVVGARDDTVAVGDAVGWRRHTSAGLRVHSVPGTHFSSLDPSPVLTDLLGADLLAAVRQREGTLAAPGPDAIHLWLADLDGHAACSGVAELSTPERLRAERFRHEEDRRRFVGRCVVLRRVLRRYGVETGTDTLPLGPHGKPFVPHPAGIRFSASHSAGLAVVGVAAGREIGVDVERIRAMRDLSAFADGALVDAERAELAAAPDRLTAALRLWTAKEALLKASGDGLTVEPSRISFAHQPTRGPWRAVVEPDLAALRSWRISHLQTEDALVAVATEAEEWALRLETVP